jgi:transcriptional regulator with XRE-family HTH domain
MFTFAELIKRIRNEAGLTQAEFAKVLDVSPVLIAMIESGQKDVSKNLLQKLACKLKVHTASITPFLYGYEINDRDSLSKVEKQFLDWGIKFQDQLIKKRSKHLRENNG